MNTNKKEATCIFCKERFLHWEKLPEGWKLLTPEGNVHRCQTSSNSKKSNSDYYQNNYNNKKKY
jgi:hypothetical protein